MSFNKKVKKYFLDNGLFFFEIRYFPFAFHESII